MPNCPKLHDYSRPELVAEHEPVVLVGGACRSLCLVRILIGQHSYRFRDVSHANTSMGAQEDCTEYEMRSVLFWELRWLRMVVC